MKDIREILQAWNGILKDKETRLNDDMTETVLDDALGLVKSNGKIETLRKQINAVQESLNRVLELLRLSESKNFEENHAFHILQVIEEYYVYLIPGVNDLCDKFISDHLELDGIRIEYDIAYRRYLRLHEQIANLRESLELPISEAILAERLEMDIPDYKSFHASGLPGISYG